MTLETKMAENWKHLKHSLHAAISSVYERDQNLLNRDANERTLSFRLAHYLISSFPEHNIDCEYNRHGDDVKRLPRITTTDTGDTKGKTIFPDLIIHERGTDDNNYAVIEIKKEGNADTERDIEKLQSLTAANLGYFYAYGIHLTFGIKSIKDAAVYINGSLDQEKTTELKELLIRRANAA